MKEGGFLLKFNGEDTTRCYAVKLDYDNWKYEVNYEETKDLPKDLKSVTIDIEHPE